MQTTRVYRVEKVRSFERLQTLAKKYRTVAVSKLYKVRAAQLAELRRALRGDVEIVAGKNRITRRALTDVGLKDVGGFVERLEGQNALIFTNMDPFRLNLILEKKKVQLPARAGDVAPEDVVIPSGNTGMPPGPVLSEFKEARVPTRIDAGSIWVTENTIVAKKGETITPKLAGLLSRLGLKPIRAGLSVAFAFFDGLILEEKDVRLDLDEYRRLIQQGHTSSYALSIGAPYPIKQTLPFILGRAHLQAHSLALEAGYVSRDTIPFLLIKSSSEAMTLYHRVKMRESS